MVLSLSLAMPPYGVGGRENRLLCPIARYSDAGWLVPNRHSSRSPAPGGGNSSVSFRTIGEGRVLTFLAQQNLPHGTLMLGNRDMTRRHMARSEGLLHPSTL